MTWLETGHAEPTGGKKLVNLMLSEALTRKTDFTQQEWETFNITDLDIHDFIKSGDSYFKPAGKTEEIFKTFDRDQDEMISEAEFLQVYTELEDNKKTTQRRLKASELFKKADKDGNNWLSRDEFSAWVKKEYPLENAEDMFTKFDANHNGKILEKEFVNAICEMEFLKRIADSKPGDLMLSQKNDKGDEKREFYCNVCWKNVARCWSCDGKGCQFCNEKCWQCQGKGMPGIKWKEIGSEKPTTGTEIINPEFATQLRRHSEFRQSQLDQFKLDKLSWDSYIKVENQFFKPAEANGCVLCSHEHRLDFEERVKTNKKVNQENQRQLTSQRTRRLYRKQFHEIAKLGWDHFDINRDGKLSKAEFHDKLSQKAGFLYGDIEKTFEALDADGNGAVTRKEFEDYFNVWQFHEIAKLGWNHFDISRDGKLSKTEFHDKLSQQAGFLYGDIEKTFKALDADGNGAVTRKEFEDYFNVWQFHEIAKLGWNHFDISRDGTMLM